MSLWHMWIIAMGPPEALFFRGGHLLFAMVLVYLIYPWRGDGKGNPGIVDWLCLAASVAAMPLAPRERSASSETATG